MPHSGTRSQQQRTFLSIFPLTQATLSALFAIFSSSRSQGLIFSLVVLRCQVSILTFRNQHLMEAWVAIGGHIPLVHRPLVGHFGGHSGLLGTTSGHTWWAQWPGQRIMLMLRPPRRIVPSGPTHFFAATGGVI